MDQVHFKGLACKLYLHISPQYIGNIEKGVDEYLNALLMKYVEVLKGVVLAYSEIHLLEPCGRIINEMPYIHFNISVKLLVFSPYAGCILTGTVTKLGSDYIGLLVYNVFNASIGREHLERYKDILVPHPPDGWLHLGNGSIIKVGTELPFMVTDMVNINNIFTVKGSFIESWLFAKETREQNPKINTMEIQKDPTTSKPSKVKRKHLEKNTSTSKKIKKKYIKKQ